MLPILLSLVESNAYALLPATRTSSNSPMKPQQRQVALRIEHATPPTSPRRTLCRMTPGSTGTRGGTREARAEDRSAWWFDFPRSIYETRKVQSCYVARRK